MLEILLLRPQILVILGQVKAVDLSLCPYQEWFWLLFMEVFKEWFAHIRSGFMEVFKEWFSMEWFLVCAYQEWL